MHYNLKTKHHAVELFGRSIVEAQSSIYYLSKAYLQDSRPCTILHAVPKRWISQLLWQQGDPALLRETGSAQLEDGCESPSGSIEFMFDWKDVLEREKLVLPESQSSGASVFNGSFK